MIVKRGVLATLGMLVAGGWCLGQNGTRPSVDESIARGEEVYTYWCATCHSAGPGMPGTQALQAKYNGTRPAVLTERADLTADQIEFYVRNGVSVMPFFRKTEVSDADLEALSAYVISEAGEDDISR